jgi:hypothetical protein
MDKTLRMRRLARVLIIVVAASASSGSGAADLRGRVDEMRSYSTNPFPASAVQVRLLDAGTGRELQTAFSGSDGFYYLRAVGPGHYLLEVNGQRYPYMVKATPQWQNIPPIRLPR